MVKSRRPLIRNVGVVLTTGRRTVSQVVRVLGELADADPSSYH